MLPAIIEAERNEPGPQHVYLVGSPEGAHQPQLRGAPPVAVPGLDARSARPVEDPGDYDTLFGVRFDETTGEVL